MKYRYNKRNQQRGNDKINQEESILKNSNLVSKLYSPGSLCASQKFYYSKETDARMSDCIYLSSFYTLIIALGGGAEETSLEF